MLKYEVRHYHEVLRYFRHGEYHRLDGPALIWKDDIDLCWFQYDQRHRIDGPAVQWGTLGKKYYIRGIRIC